MTVLFISFTTRPNQGGEGGVGWEFALAAARACASVQEGLILMIDSRDEPAVRNCVGADALPRQCEIHPVALPRIALKMWGDSRTRGSYLIWRVRAKRTVRRLLRQRKDINVIHQVTFATATMPPAIPHLRRAKPRTVWGPVTVPAAPIANYGRNAATLVERGAIEILKALSRRHVKTVDVVVATNAITSRHLRLGVGLIEPNVVIEPAVECEGAQFDLVMAGLLIDRKRPWLAIEMLAEPALLERKLLVIGDGPLREPMEILATKLGVRERVEFIGRVTRSETIRLIGLSQVLIHPSAREGSPWVIGEAAAAGVPAVVVAGSGAETTATMAYNGSAIAKSATPAALAAALGGVSLQVRQPSTRWTRDRLPNKLLRYWGL